jgi:hypothetical protein
MMTKLNHNRPYLKCVDNIKREIAEIESWNKSEKDIVNAMHDRSVGLKIEATTPYGDGRKKPIKEMDKKIHLLACSILDHVHIHRETSLIAKLLNAIAASTRKNALIEWFKAHGECEWNARNKCFDFMKNAETLQAEAEALPFWEFKPELKPKYNEIDFDKSLEDLLKRAIKRQAEIEAAKAKDADYVSPDKLNVDHIKAVQELLAAKPAGTCDHFDKI